MEGKLHAWRIEDREYARRQEERRGRRHAFETLEPARTALVVIDMVPFFVSGGGYCLGIVPKIASIADALRGVGGMLVAWVVPTTADRLAVSEEFFGPETAAAFRRSGGDGPVAGRISAALRCILMTCLPRRPPSARSSLAVAPSRHCSRDAASPPS